MKNLYARFVLWLAQPLVDQVEVDKITLSASIDGLAAACRANANAIAAEQAARQAGDGALSDRIQPFEF
ncbi:hypothetical protein [Burkholderia sp. 22PA0106]|uniref:hypothetical protein n=1 Tax=Burkholderia sp. 22PA0106 TaxID=3237371 RepID=UPI0039C37EB1